MPEKSIYRLFSRGIPLLSPSTKGNPLTGKKEKMSAKNADEQEEKMTKTRKNVTLIILIICLFAFVWAAFIAVNVNEAKAAGESYTLSFKSNERESITKSMNGWWSGSGGANGITQSGDLITVDFSAAGNVAYCDGVNLTAGKTYSISVEYKKVSGGGKFHIFYKGSSWKLIKDWISSGDEWATYTTTFTAAIDADTFIIQNPNTTEESVVQFKNVIFYETTEMTVTAGSAIGTLPEVPAKDGCDGYWTIDGEKITVDTVYNYGANKTAVAEYKVAYKLSFGSNDYDMASSAETWTRHKAPTVENGVATLTRSASDGTINYAAGVGKYMIEEGKTYKITLSFKTDAKMSFLMSTEVPDYSAKIIPHNDYDTPEFTYKSYDYTATKSGKLDFIFQLLGGEGNIFVKDFYCYEEIADSVTVTKNDKIGVLPEIPVKEGYEGYWAIDGEKITADTVYNYGSNKTAVIAYKKQYALSFKMSDYDMAASAETWTRHKAPTVENGVATLPRAEGDTGAINYAAGVGKYTVETGKNYRLELKIKSDNVCVRFTTEKPDYKAIFINTWVNNADYIAYSFDYTATATGPVDFIFQLTAGTGNLYIKDFYFYEKNDMAVTAGSTIGTLPEVPVKEGYDGYWTIDGEKITADTVYNYGADKVAVPVYEEMKQQYTLTFRSNDYDMASTTDWAYNTPTANEDGGVTMTRDTSVATGTPVNYAPKKEYELEVGKTYIVRFKLKCDNTYINLGTEPGYEWFFNGWYSNSTYVEYIKEFTPTKGGSQRLIFQLTAGGGNISVKDFYLYEQSEMTVTAGSAIGTLPEVPAKDGYNGYWTIDGEKITADTVYDYNADKIAVAAYKADNKIESVSLSLDGNIGLNIYAKVVDESKVYATVGSVRKELTEYTLSGANRLYTVGVAAKDYADKIKFEIGDYTAEVGVKDYIEVAKTRFSDNVSLLALLEGLETYCDSAEKYFANETVGSVTATDRGYTGFAPEITGTLPSGVTVRGITLELASMTSIRIYLGGNLSGVSCTVNGEATTVKTTASADGTVNYYLEKSNIAAKDLDETYEFGIGDCKINVSAIAYVNMAMGKQTENFDNLLKALYNYNVAANAYFPDEYDLSEATDMADTLVYAKSLENGVNGTFDNAAKEHYTITNQNVSLTHAVNVPASETAGQRQVTSLKNLKGGTYVSNTMDVFVLTTSNTEKYAKNSTDIISTTWPNGYNKTEKACAPYVNTTRLGYYYYEVNVRNLNFGDNLYLDKTYHVYSDRMYQVYRLINSNSSAVSTIKQVTFQTMIPKSSVTKFEIRNGDTITTSYSSNALGSTEFRYAAFDIEGVGVLAFINTSTDCSFWLMQDNDNYYFRQVKKVGTLEAGGEVSFGTRVYTDTTHDFSGMRAADEIERNPLTADDITVTGHSTSLDGTGFVGYDKLKGHYVMNIAGSGFADAYGEPDKKYIDNIKVVAKDDRDVFFMVHSTCPLEGAALTDKNDLLIPMGLEVMKNFDHEVEEPIYDPADKMYGDTLFPVKLAKGKTLEFSLVNVYQNWGKYPLKQISSISYYVSYYHMSTGVTETNCLAPYYSTYLNKDDVGSWILPDFRGMSNDGQTYEEGGSEKHSDLQNNSVGAVNGVSNGSSLSSSEADLGIYQGSDIHSSGLTYADMNYSYTSKNGSYDVVYRHVEMPQTDEGRTYYTVEISFKKSTSLKYADFSIFSFDARVNGDYYKNAAYIDANGNKQVVSIDSTKLQSTTSIINKWSPTLYKLNKGSSYFTYYNMVRDGIHESGNFALIVKDYAITVNGQASDIGLAFYNDRIKRNSAYSNRGSLTIAENTTFAAGDKITVNVILLPYGKGSGESDISSVEKVYKDSATEALKVTATKGAVVEDDFIATVRAASYGVAEFTLSGGAIKNSEVNYAIRVKGLKKLGKLKVEKKNASGEWETVEIASTDGFDGYSVIYEKDGTLEYSFIVTKTESDVTYRVSVE